MEVATPDQADSHWTTVQHRHTCSHGSLPDKRTVTNEQVKVFDLATEHMTCEQRQQIKRCQEKVQPWRENLASSWGEGPSDPKEKMTDLREWGGLNLSSEDLNMETQVAALRSFDKKTLDYSKEKKSRHKKRSVSPSEEWDQQHKVPKQRSHHSATRKKASGRSKMLVETQPSAQIAPKSYLGTALKSIGCSKGPRYPSELPSSLGSESPSSRDKSLSRSSSNPSGDDTQSSSSFDDRYQSKRQRDNCHGQNKWRRRSSSGWADNIKSIPPKEYDGSADVRAYHRFVHESDTYLWDGKVRGQWKFFLLLYYLTGKACDFYTQKVAINEEEWNVPDFYTALFDYCFPVDYWMKLRRTLAHCHKNEKSVAEYTHTLQDLFNMIGNVPKQEQVLKFWNSSRPSIQKELWRNKLNPELSSWRKVVVQAEIIEIAKNVAKRRDQNAGQPNQASGSGGSNPRHKTHLMDRSVWAVSFRSHQKWSDRHRGKPNHNVQSGQQQESTPYSRDGTPAKKTSSKNGSVPPNHHYNNHRHTHWKRPLLSDKEKAEYQAAGWCFGCGKEGHMSHNCPDNASIKSPGQGPYQRTPQSISHYSRHSRHLRQSPIHPPTQTTKPPPATRNLTIVWPTCPAYVSDLRV